jgi:hypothetical protein
MYRSSQGPMPTPNFCNTIRQDNLFHQLLQILLAEWFGRIQQFSFQVGTEFRHFPFVNRIDYRQR